MKNERKKGIDGLKKSCMMDRLLELGKEERSRRKKKRYRCRCRGVCVGGVEREGDVHSSLNRSRLVPFRFTFMFYGYPRA